MQKEKMERLAQSFPTLMMAPGTVPFNADKLAKWARGPEPGHGARCAARFVLTVWNPGVRWRCGRFDLMEALSSWDDEHRGAFLRWVQKPWWP